MGFRMASPWEDPDTGILYLRIRTPTDVLPRVKGQKVTVSIAGTPVSVKVGTLVKASLRTRDPREAKERFIKAQAALAAYWEAVRSGPRQLSPREAVALSGEVYRAWADAFTDDPATPETWQQVLEANEDARAGEFGRGALMIGHHARVRKSLDERFGPFADHVLRRHGLVVDEESRARLLTEVARAADQAARLNLKRAEGDYRPDPNADRFPPVTPAKPTSPALSIKDLFEAWQREAVQLGRASATVDRYRSVFDRLHGFLGHDDAKAVSDEDVIRYKDALLADGIAGKTIKDGHLAALKSVFGWAVENKRLASNPAAEVKLRAEKKKQTRPKGFTDEEAELILKAALNYSREGRESAHLAAAKRWVPWLLAFTGARVADVTGLRKESFDLRGTPSVRIEDGKTGTFRDVPLHPQLVEIGFTDFVRAAGPGPLFYDARSDKGQAPQSQAEKIGKWVRSLGVDDPRVQPSHGWRHRFTTLARSVGMDHEKREFILGHALPGLGDTYGDMAGLRREIEKLPYYAVRSP